MRALITETDKVMRNIPVYYRCNENEGDESRQKHVRRENNISYLLFIRKKL